MGVYQLSLCQHLCRSHCTDYLSYVVRASNCVNLLRQEKFSIVDLRKKKKRVEYLITKIEQV